MMKKDTPNQHLKSLLHQELERRIEANPLYSMRSFARALGVSHSLLSLVLSGKREISSKLAERMGELLGVSITQSPLESPTLPAGSWTKLFSLEEFERIADWKYYAILSLLEIPDSKCTANFIASRLGITKTEASLAIEKLKSLGIIELVAGRWQQSTKPIRVENKKSSEGTRRFHHGLLQKSAESLDHVSSQYRDLSAVTFAMHPKNVGYALKRIRDFRRTLMKELEGMGDIQEVYNLNVQLIPLTKINEKNISNHKEEK